MASVSFWGVRADGLGGPSSAAWFYWEQLLSLGSCTARSTCPCALQRLQAPRTTCSCAKLGGSCSASCQARSSSEGKLHVRTHACMHCTHAPDAPLARARCAELRQGYKPTTTSGSISSHLIKLRQTRGHAPAACAGACGFHPCPNPSLAGPPPRIGHAACTCKHTRIHAHTPSTHTRMRARAHTHTHTHCAQTHLLPAHRLVFMVRLVVRVQPLAETGPKAGHAVQPRLLVLLLMLLLGGGCGQGQGARRAAWGRAPCVAPADMRALHAAWVCNGACFGWGIMCAYVRVCGPCLRGCARAGPALGKEGWAAFRGSLAQRFWPILCLTKSEVCRGVQGPRLPRPCCQPLQPDQFASWSSPPKATAAWSKCNG